MLTMAKMNEDFAALLGAAVALLLRADVTLAAMSASLLAGLPSSCRCSASCRHSHPGLLPSLWLGMRFFTWAWGCLWRRSSRCDVVASRAVEGLREALASSTLWIGVDLLALFGFAVALFALAVRTLAAHLD
jgi:hypothetical protein